MVLLLLLLLFTLVYCALCVCRQVWEERDTRILRLGERERERGWWVVSKTMTVCLCVSDFSGRLLFEEMAGPQQQTKRGAENEAQPAPVAKRVTQELEEQHQQKDNDIQEAGDLQPPSQEQTNHVRSCCCCCWSLEMFTTVRNSCWCCCCCEFFFVVSLSVSLCYVKIPCCSLSRCWICFQQFFEQKKKKRASQLCV